MGKGKVLSTEGAEVKTLSQQEATCATFTGRALSVESQSASAGVTGTKGGIIHTSDPVGWCPGLSPTLSSTIRLTDWGEVGSVRHPYDGLETADEFSEHLLDREGRLGETCYG